VRARAARAPGCSDRIPPMTSSKELPQSAVRQLEISRVDRGLREHAEDLLAVEEPLEIQISFHKDGRPVHRTISITMRTPGSDYELAAGFLFTEMLIASREQITSIRHCGKPPAGHPANVVRVELEPSVSVDMTALERHFYTTSSCGVCGKTSIEALQMGKCAPLQVSTRRVSEDVIGQLPQRLREAQETFATTGGLHAAGLFTFAGELLELREDVGRHNAVDKVIGSQFIEGRIPLSERILMLSGRVSFELVQKALVAGIPVVAAVGAPSSLAIDTARAFGMTVCGFVRDDRFNIYSGEERISPLPRERGAERSEAG